MRASGILMPVFSLPGPFGIGTLGKEAFAFVDFLAEAKQTYWQILPLGPTGYGDSPYQPFSTFAGNPYLIDLETLIEEELLTKEECDGADLVGHPNYVEYGKLYENRFPSAFASNPRLKYSPNSIKSAPAILSDVLAYAVFFGLIFSYSYTKKPYSFTYGPISALMPTDASFPLPIAT